MHDDETDIGNYRPVSLLSVPSKILESEINSTLVQHIFKSNNLASDRQWAYRAGYSTELLLIHLTESWRRAVDSGMVVAAAFVDFKKAFDSVSHDILLKKLNCEFGVNGSLLDLIRNYLSGRQQFTVLNGVKSDLLPESMGIPQGSVLGRHCSCYSRMTCLVPCLLGLFICMQTILPYTVSEKQQTW